MVPQKLMWSQLVVFASVFMLYPSLGCYSQVVSLWDLVVKKVYK